MNWSLLALALNLLGVFATLLIGPGLLLIAFVYGRALGPVRSAKLTLRCRRISTAGMASMFGGIAVFCAALALQSLFPD